jgi:RES domain-containing protein
MNPAGISYLYLAVDEPTAVREIVGISSAEVVVAEFRAIQEISVLDLTRMPDKPSVFDAERREQREGLIFLKHFAQTISQPVAKDGLEHVSYVPSQVISEYFALVFKNPDGTSLDGILYPSAVNPGGVNLVLFPSRRDISRKFDAVRFERANSQRVVPTSK